MVELETLKMETNKYRADRNIPPSKRRQLLVEPNLAFIASISVDLTLAVEKVRSSIPPPRRNIICWNCNSEPYCSRFRKPNCFR